MAEQDFRIRYYKMMIQGLEDERFVVAKLRRVSSPPVQVGSVSDSMGSAFGRLVDIIRLGRQNRNFADLKAVESALAPRWLESAEEEWAEYEKVVCRVLGVERLAPLLVTPPPRLGSQPSSLAVTFHEATMNTLPYLVARIGTVYGSPAPELLTHPHEQESALARLQDVFRIGIRGQAFRDFVEAGRKRGMKEADIVRSWMQCEAHIGHRLHASM